MNLNLRILDKDGALLRTYDNYDFVEEFTWSTVPANEPAVVAGGCLNATLVVSREIDIAPRNLVQVELDGVRVYRGMLTMPPEKHDTLEAYVYELAGEVERLAEITLSQTNRYFASESLTGIIATVLSQATNRSAITYNPALVPDLTAQPNVIVSRRGTKLSDVLENIFTYINSRYYHGVDANGVYFVDRFNTGTPLVLTTGTECDWSSPPQENLENVVNLIRGVRGDKYQFDVRDNALINQYGEIQKSVDIPAELGSIIEIQTYLNNLLVNEKATDAEGTLELYRNDYAPPPKRVQVFNDAGDFVRTYDVYQADYKLTSDGLETSLVVGRKALEFQHNERERNRRIRNNSSRLDEHEDKLDKLGDVRRIDPLVPFDADGFVSLDAYKDCSNELFNADSELWDRTELHKIDAIEERQTPVQMRKTLDRANNLPSTDANAYSTLVPNSCLRTYDGQDETFEGGAQGGTFDPATYDGLDEVKRDALKRLRYHTIENDDYYRAIPGASVGSQPAGLPSSSIDPVGTQSRNEFSDWLHEELEGAGGTEALTLAYTLTATPQLLSATPCPDGNDVLVEWSQPTDQPWNWDYTAVTKFQIRHKKEDATEWTESAELLRQPVDPQDYTITGLELGQRYIVELKVFYNQTRNVDTDDDGVADAVQQQEFDNGWSESITVLTLDDSARAVPQNVQHTQQVFGARVTWDTPAGTDTYVDTTVVVTHENGTETLTGLTTPADLNLNPHNGDYVENSTYDITLTHNYNTGASCDVTSFVTAGAPEYPLPVVTIVTTGDGFELNVTAPIIETFLTWQGMRVEVFNAGAYVLVGASVNTILVFNLDPATYARDVARNLRLTHLYTDTRFSVTAIPAERVDSITIPSYGDETPQNFVLAGDEAQIIASWNNPTDPELTFDGVELDALLGTWQNIYTGTLETDTLLMSELAGLQRGVNYDFRLRATYTDAFTNTVNSDYVLASDEFTPVSFAQPQNIVSESSTAGFAIAWESPPTDTSFRTYVETQLEIFQTTWQSLATTTDTELQIILDDTFPQETLIPVRVRHVYTDVPLSTNVNSEWTDTKVKKLGVPAPEGISALTTDHGFTLGFSDPANNLPTGVTLLTSRLERFDGTNFVTFQTAPFTLDPLAFVGEGGSIFERASDARFRLRHEYTRDSDSQQLNSDWREFTAHVGKLRPGVEDYALLNDDDGFRVSWKTPALLDNTTYTETQVEINGGTNWLALGAFTSTPQTIALDWNTYERAAEYLVRTRHRKSYQAGDIFTDWAVAPVKVGRDVLLQQIIVTRSGTYTYPLTGAYAFSSDPVKLTGNGTLVISEFTTSGITNVTITVTDIGQTTAASSISPYASAQSGVNYLGIELALE